MPKQVPKKCRWCEYTAGNGGALSSHAKTKHPDEWAAFKTEQDSTKGPKPTISAESEPPPPEEMAGFRFGAHFVFEIVDGDQPTWQALADQVFAEILAAVRAAPVPASVAMLDGKRSMLIPFRDGQQRGTA